MPTLLLLLASLLPSLSDAVVPIGPWRAVLASPGGELPFTIVFAAPGASPPAVAVNGPERVPFSSVVVDDGDDGRTVTLGIEWFDSAITATLAPDGASMRGAWTKTIPDGVSTLPFEATRGDPRRFSSLAPDSSDSSDSSDASDADVAGGWAVTFTDEGGAEPARATFAVDGRAVTGTFQTPTGDYRYLAGDVRGDRLRLSCFDGGHAFLFDARLGADGRLVGDFWSRDSYHATWTATRVDEEAAEKSADESDGVLPDPWELVSLTDPGGRFRFAFDDLEGRLVRHDDARFRGEVVVVNLFGSWCPNCHDEAPLLAEWQRRYGARGLALVGLAFEFSGDVARDREMVRRYARRHGIDYPLLLAGTSDKRRAAERVPDLSRIVAYPTTIFIGRDGLVRKIHSGYSGPATGEEHAALVAEFEALLERLLSE